MTTGRFSIRSVTSKRRNDRGLGMVQLRRASQTQSSTLSRCPISACLTNTTSRTRRNHLQHSCDGRFLEPTTALGHALSIVNTPATAHPQGLGPLSDERRAYLKHLQRFCDGERLWRREEMTASTRACTSDVNTIAMADNLRCLSSPARKGVRDKFQKEVGLVGSTRERRSAQ
jgi:hypothetical protein